MKNGKSIIKSSIQIAILRDRLPDLENRLFADYSAKNQNEIAEIAPQKVNSFLEKVGELYRVEETIKRLSKVNEFSSIGEYINLFSKAYKYQSKSLLLSIGFSIDDANDVLRNAKPVTSFPPHYIVQLCRKLQLSLSNAESLIRNSVVTYNFRPLVKGGMARYDTKRGGDEKDESMKKGLTELLLKASQKKPLLASNNIIDDEKLNLFLIEFKQEWPRYEQ